MGVGTGGRYCPFNSNKHAHFAAKAYILRVKTSNFWKYPGKKIYLVYFIQGYNYQIITTSMTNN